VPVFPRQPKIIPTHSSGKANTPHIMANNQQNEKILPKSWSKKENTFPTLVYEADNYY
jgi:hypothetical protein